MDRKGLSFLGVLLAASAVTRSFPAGFTTSSTTGRAPTQWAEAHSTEPESSAGIWPTVYAYFGIVTRNESNPAQEWDCISAPPIETLIATVPDPEKTHLALYFDRSIESLMWAISDSGYAFQGFWLPWKTRSEKELVFLKDRDQSEKSFANRHKLPGILFFRPRHDLAQTKPMAVFVVGETPTSGIDLHVLETALNYASRLEGNAAGVEAVPHEVRIVGPTFSGSFGPFAHFLQTYPGSMRVSSGTATSFPSGQHFDEVLGGRVKRISTIENDEYASRLLLEYAWTRWWVRNEIALLSEDDTVYGALSPKAANSSEAPLPKRKEKHRDILLMRYPREIARVRNARREENELAPVNQKREPQAGDSPAVALSLKDSGDDGSGDRDVLPAFSARQTPASQEAALLAISGAIRRENAAMAGILATDVLDTVFLGRFLRRACPETRLFTLDSDLLLVRPESNSFQGVLSVTSYPLFSRNQHWTARQLQGQWPRRVQFSSKFAEGVYNACRLLVEPAANSPGERVLEYSQPVESGRQKPALWLTVVGREHYWPLALLDQTYAARDPEVLAEVRSTISSSNLADPPHGPMKPEPPSLAWTVLFGIVTVVTFLHCVYTSFLLLGPDRDADSILTITRYRLPHGTERTLFWCAERFRSFKFLKRLSRLFGPYPRFEQFPKVRERVFLFCITLFLFAAVFLLSSCAARFLPLGFDLDFRWWVPIWTGRLMLLLSGLLALWLALLFRTQRGSEDLVNLYLFVVVPVIVLTVLVCVMWASFLLDIPARFATLGLLILLLPLPWLIRHRTGKPGAVFEPVLKGFRIIWRYGSLLPSRSRHISRYLFRVARIIWPGPVFRFLARVTLLPAFVVLISGIYLLCINLGFLYHNPPATLAGLFMAYRSLHLTNGVAPVLPIWLVAAGFLVWAWVQLYREKMIVPRTDFRDAVERLGIETAQNPYDYDVEKSRSKVDQVLEEYFSERLWGSALLFCAVWLLISEPWFKLRSIESAPYDITYVTVLVVLHWSICVTWFQFYETWRAFKNYLEALERHPIHEAFSRLEKQIKWVPLGRVVERQLFISTRTYDVLKRILSFSADKLPQPEKASFTALQEPLRTLEGYITPAMREAQEAIVRDGEVNQQRYSELQAHFEAAGNVISGSLANTEWNKGASDYLQRFRDKSEKRELSPSEELRIIQEEYLALRHLIYLRYVFRHLRNLLGFIACGFIIAVISVNSYPFRGERWIGYSSVLGLFTIGAGIAVVFAQMDRDAVLSRITETKVNEIGTSFWLRLARFGVLPLLTVLAGQFPEINNLFFSWVRPALEALK